jgi:hypothetical protein
MVNIVIPFCLAVLAADTVAWELLDVLPVTRMP